MTNDLINGLFEFTGALFIFYHCRTLFRDKLVKGVSILSTVYFFSWGLWNLFYYPSLNQTWSFIGGVAIMLANITWIGMMVYYHYFFLHMPRPTDDWIAKHGMPLEYLAYMKKMGKA